MNLEFVNEIIGNLCATAIVITGIICLYKFYK